MNQTARKQRLLGFGLLGLFAAGGISLGVSLYVTRDASAEAVRAYADAISPFRKEGGSIIGTGLRPRIADLELGRVRPEQFRNEALGWLTGLRRVRAQIAAVPIPRGLGDVAAGIDRALGRYLETIDAFVRASNAIPGRPIEEAIDVASRIGEDADRMYDVATDELDALVARLGAREPKACDYMERCAGVSPVLAASVGEAGWVQTFKEAEWV